MSRVLGDGVVRKRRLRHVFETEHPGHVDPAADFGEHVHLDDLDLELVVQACQGVSQRLVVRSDELRDILCEARTSGTCTGHFAEVGQVRHQHVPGAGTHESVDRLRGPLHCVRDDRSGILAAPHPEKIVAAGPHDVERVDRDLVRVRFHVRQHLLGVDVACLRAAEGEALDRVEAEARTELFNPDRAVAGPFVPVGVRLGVRLVAVVAEAVAKDHDGGVDRFGRCRMPGEDQGQSPDNRPRNPRAMFGFVFSSEVYICPSVKRENH